MRLKKREAQPIAASAMGHIDRYTNGIVAGWFFCSACESSLAHGVTFSVDASPISCEIHAHDRHDVPGGSGFALRFDRELAPQDATTFTIACALHEQASITHEIEPARWHAATIAVIERCDQREISGWLAEPSPSYRPLTLRLPEVDATLAVWRESQRPDVSAALAGAPAWGFRLDLHVLLGWVTPPDTEALLMKGDCTLSATRVKDEALQTAAIRCDCPTIDGRAIPASEWDIRHRLQREPSVGEVDARWLLGTDVVDPGIDQWDRWLHFLAFDEATSLIWKALVLQQRAGLPSLSAIPSSLQVKIRNSQIDERSGGTSSTWFAKLLEQVQAQSSQQNFAIPDDMFYLLRDLDATPSPLDHERTTPWDGRRVCVAGMVGHGSGLGDNAGNSVMALREAGFDVCTAPFMPYRGQWRRDLMMDAPQCLDLSEHLVLLHVPLDCVAETLRMQPALLRAPHIIGYFMWETEGLPRELARALDVVDQVWTASEFVANTFRFASQTEVAVTGHHVDVSRARPLTRTELGLSDDQFIVHFSFDANSTLERKNPLGAVQAFKRAFPTDPNCSLLLKVRNPTAIERDAAKGSALARQFLDEIASDPRIRVIAEDMAYNTALGLIQVSDCLLSLHRSEGYGYVLAEAQLLGKPVVYTDYAAPLEFLQPFGNRGVPSTPAKLLPEDYFYWHPDSQWANADLDAAARALLEVKADWQMTLRAHAVETPLHSMVTRYRELLLPLGLEQHAHTSVTQDLETS